MLLSTAMLPEHACPSPVALAARLSHDRFRSGTAPGKCELSQSVEPAGGCRRSLARSTGGSNTCILVPALCREGLFLVYCIRRITLILSLCLSFLDAKRMVKPTKRLCSKGRML